MNGSGTSATKPKAQCEVLQAACKSMCAIDIQTSQGRDDWMRLCAGITTPAVVEFILRKPWCILLKCHDPIAIFTPD